MSVTENDRKAGKRDLRQPIRDGHHRDRIAIENERNVIAGLERLVRSIWGHGSWTGRLRVHFDATIYQIDDPVDGNACTGVGWRVV